MTRYVHIANGAVNQTELPTTGRLSDGRVVSGFDKLPPEVLKEEDWLPLFDEPPTYDAETQVIEDGGYDVQTDQVVQIWNVVSREPYLTTTLETIPPDGVTFAEVVYMDPRSTPSSTSVVFSVNGVLSSPVTLANGRASINVVSQTSDDTVLVQTEGLEVTIGVTNG